MMNKMHIRILQNIKLIVGLINLEKLIVYKNDDKTIQMMKNYIENNDIENRKVDIKEVKKTIINA